MRRPSHLPMAKLAYQDPRFMESLPARPLRILAEYLDPLARLRREKVADTIVMFGSARLHSRGRGPQELKELRARAHGRRSGEWGDRIRLAKSHVEMSRYYEECRELSRRITSWS